MVQATKPLIFNLISGYRPLADIFSGSEGCLLTGDFTVSDASHRGGGGGGSILVQSPEINPVGQARHRASPTGTSYIRLEFQYMNTD